MRILETLPGFAAYMAGRKFREQTTQTYVRDVRQLAAWLGDHAAVADVTPETVDRYQAALGHRAASTIGQRLSAIRCWSRYLMRAGLATGGPLSRGGIEHVFDRWLGVDLDIDARLGAHLHPHKLRTTFSTFFIWSGGSLITLQKLLGHRDLNTTQHYVLSDDEQKRREVGRLRFDRRED